MPPPYCYTGVSELPILGLLTGGGNTRADYIAKQEFKHLLAALMPPNRLALEVSLATGLRISDVLNLRTERLEERMTIRELKTGKTDASGCRSSCTSAACRRRAKCGCSRAHRLEKASYPAGGV